MIKHSALRVVHVVDAMGGDSALWGKERAIQALMRAQRAAGLQPALVCFSNGCLAREMRAEGFRVDCLEDRPRLVPTHSLPALIRVLRDGPIPVVHTHGYKANVVGRLARLGGVPMRTLVSTCHGWDEQTWRLWLYNRIDRRLSCLSDVVTVPDQGMVDVFLRREKVVHVANGVAYRPMPTPQARASARERFGFRPDDFVIGFLGRVDEPKGALDVLAAAGKTRKQNIVWALAGTGEAESRIRIAGFENVRLLGYIDDTDAYLSALDAYVQTSHSEGLSLALLEAMRAGLPALATRVGSTESAVRHDMEGMLVNAGDVDDLVRQVLLLKSSPSLCRRLGLAARLRFETTFDIRHQHQALLDLYRTPGGAVSHEEMLSSSKRVALSTSASE